MSRFYLHLRDHVDQVLDPEGREFADMAAVIKAVRAGALDTLANELKRGGIIDLRYRIDAENDAGEIVYTLPFADAVTILANDAS